MNSARNDLPLAGTTTVRAASDVDGEFLLRVYASTRMEESAAFGWNAEQQAAFLRMQFEARQRSYATAYPSAQTSLIHVDGVPAGAVVIFRCPNEIRLVDIALLPEHRERGIGTQLMQALISEATDSRCPLRLSFLRGNRAAHLYERLGFRAVGGDAMYCEMELAAKESRERGTAARSSTEPRHVGKTE